MRKRNGIILMLMGVMMAGLGFFAGTAQAHNPNVWHDCQGVHWDFDAYEQATAAVTVDNVVVDSEAGFSFWDGSYPWDPTKNHTYTVQVDDNGTEFDRIWVGEQEACQQSSTTVAQSTSTLPKDTSTSSSPTIPSTTVLSTTTVIPPSTTVSPTSTEAATTSSVSTGTAPVPSSSTPTFTPQPIFPKDSTGGRPGTLPQTGTELIYGAYAIAMLFCGSGYLIFRLARR